MIDILIVEDDAFIAELYQKQLTYDGYTVSIVSDGKEALESLKKEIPRLILLDIMLPKMSGIDVLKAVKAEKELKDIPIVILSNLGQDDIVNQALSIGANSYLIKSNFVPAEVVKEIKNYL